MQALTVLLAMPRCRRMRRCMARCSISCSPDVAAGRSAVRESQLLQLDSLKRRVSRAEKQVLDAEQGCQWRQVHGKRRRLANLKSRLAGLQADIAAGRVRLCFGSKKLWRKQQHLE